MAGVYSKTEDQQIEPQMTCCLGNHPLDKPKLLPCQHSFCTECIKTKMGHMRKEFVCPKCDLSIPLTKKEVDQLPEDVLYQILQEKKSRTECVCCKFEGKKTPGTFQCLDCADVLCDQCQRGHTKTSFTLSHKVVRMKDIQEGKFKSEIQDEKTQLCPVHSEGGTLMPLKLYCEECRCLACQICFFTDHQPKGHTCKSIDEMHDRKITALRGQITQLLDLKKRVTEFTAVLERELGQNREHKEQLETEVHDRATQFIEVIEKVKEDILQTIKGHFEKEDTSIQMKLDETKNKVIYIDSHVSYIQEFLKHSVKSQFLQHENEIMKRLKHQNEQKMDNSLTTTRFEIGQPQYDQTKAFVQQAFGKIDFKTKILKGTVKRHGPCVLMEKPEVVFCVNRYQSNSYGLAVNGSEDIISVYGSTVQMYSSNGNDKGTFKCSQLQDDAWNVVARGDILYVSNNSGDGNVHVMDYKGKVKKTITCPESRIPFSFTHQSFGLAVDVEGTLYICSFTSNNIYKCEPNERKAKLFIPQGTHPDLNQPWYLCTTSTGELVVSNRGSYTVQVYNRQGQFLWQYRGQGDMALGEPNGVCCDTDDHIYIADRGNHRIQVIKDEVLQGCIKIKDLTCPYGIALDKDNNIVCGYNLGEKIVKVKVWQ